MSENVNIAAVAPQVAQTNTARVQQQQTASTEAPKVQASAPVAEQSELSVQELQAAIDKLNEFIQQGQRSLSFSIDEAADEVVVRVVDTETQELIRQIPNEEALRLKQHLDGVLGLLFNDKA